MDIKILAVVVTYYPEMDLLNNDIKSFIDYVDKVLVWENTPHYELKKYRDILCYDKIEYCGDGINSISHALNYAWKYAQQNNYDYLLTMDQDSIFDNFYFLKKYAEDHFHENAILGPVLNKNDYKIRENNPATKRECLITSGSLIYVGVLNELGGYNEKLEIDGIDTELCLRANLKGISSYQVENCNLKQRFGKTEIRHLFGKEFLLSSYSTKRLESILKSHIYLMRKYNNMSKDVKKHIIRHYVIERIRDIVLFEDDKFIKITYMLKGIVKGLLVRI